MIKDLEFPPDIIPVFSSLYGSFQYNLTDHMSDFDYLIYFIPKNITEFDPNVRTKSIKLYKREEGVECNLFDIRSLLPNSYSYPTHLGIKSFFTTELISSEKCRDTINEIILIREDLVKADLPSLYTGKIRELGYRNGDRLYDDVKTIYTLYREYDLLDRYARNNFTSFMKAVRYGFDKDREELMKIKWYNYDIEELNILLEEKVQLVDGLEELYMNQPVNKSIQDKYIELINKAISKVL